MQNATRNTHSEKMASECKKTVNCKDLSTQTSNITNKNCDLAIIQIQ